MGLPSSGKTTLFNLLTGQTADTTPFASGKKEINLGSVMVPDVRIDRLIELNQPKKITHTEISFVDLAGLPNTDDRKGIDDMIPHLRDADALTLVVRDFENASAPAALGKVNCVSELNSVKSDLIFADLNTAEKRLERLEREKRGGDKDKIREYEIFEKAKEMLENEQFLSEMKLEPHDEKLIVGYGLLTKKRYVVMHNFGEGSGEIPEELAKEAASMGAPLVSMNTLLEHEVMEIPEEERAEYCESLGIAGDARDKFVRAAYDALNLISFFTAGPKEVRAWTVERGATAQRAAGKIHSDMERGFIRAEVIPFDVMSELETEKAVKEAGKMSLEGRSYIVNDGDVLVIRFSA